MAENNLDTKPSRTSILKLKKGVSEANDSTNDYREVRRVSFASSNFIKPFAADPEKNTIWDNTYEEEVLADSTRSNDQILDMTLEVTDFKECDKENYVPVNLSNDSVFKIESTCLQTNGNVTINLEQDMEFTNVLTNYPIVNKNIMSMQTKNTWISGKIQNTKLTEISLTDNTNAAEKTTTEIQDMQLTCDHSFSEVMDVTRVDLTDNIVEENMELTCALTNIPLSNVDFNKYTSDNATEKCKQNSVNSNNNEFTKTTKHSHTESDEIWKGTSNETDFGNKVAELYNNQKSFGESKLQEHMVDTLQDKSFVPSSRKSIANVTTDHNMEMSMQLTCVLPNINVDKTSLNANENVSQYDMELTCALTSHPQSNINTTNELTTRSVNALKNIDQTKHEANKELTLSNKKSDEKNICMNHVLEYSKNARENFPKTSEITYSQEQTIGEVQDMQLTCVPSLQKSVANLTSNNSLDISMQLTCVAPPSQITGTSVDISNVPKEDIEDMDILCSYRSNFKLIPNVLSIEETCTSSFAMILNDTPHSEHPGKKIYSTKPLLSTSKMDGVSDSNSEIKEETQLINNSSKTEVQDQSFLTKSTMGLLDNSISSQNNCSVSYIPSHLKISTEIQSTEATYSERNKNYSDTTSKTNSIVPNLEDTISVEIPSTSKFVNDIHSLVDTTPPYLEECDEKSKDSEQLCESITHDSDSWESLLKQAKDVLGLPKVSVPELSVNLFDKLIQADLRTLELLESLKVSEIDTVDLEEMYKLEFGSGDAVTVDSGNNCREETRLSDIVVPQTLEELVKEAATRSENYWEFVKSANDWYCFHIFYGVVSFKTKVQPDKGVVDEIHVYDNMEEDAVPLLRYLSQCLRNKLTKENLLLPLGENFDLLTLLDYVSICVDEVKQFFVEFNKLEEEYGPTHKFRMNPDFCVIVEVMKIKSIIWWIITINISTTNVGSITHVSARHIYEEVDEKHIQNIGNGLMGPKCLRNFILHLEEYVKKVIKQVAARTENEFL